MESNDDSNLHLSNEDNLISSERFIENEGKIN